MARASRETQESKVPVFLPFTPMSRYQGLDDELIHLALIGMRLLVLSFVHRVANLQLFGNRRCELLNERIV